VLAALFDWLGRYEQAATIAGFAFNPLTAAWIPEIGDAIAHLRDVLGDHNYEPLARKGEIMTPPKWRRTRSAKSRRPEQN
jgi:hypothetical protein